VGPGVELGASLEIDAPRAPLFPAKQGLGPAPIALGDLDVRPDGAGERGVKAQLVDDPGRDALGLEHRAGELGVDHERVAAHDHARSARRGHLCAAIAHAAS
jgi:hypothetical protein